ncbi:MAG: creatininase family protein, partial [Spirochaetales bacterium]|nr:creatininase family protein [Spirochaetales bacterium]
MNAPHFPLMTRMSVKDLREYLEGKRSIILPLGTIEQHGYHLPVSTDAIVAESLSHRVGKRTGVLVAPTIAAAFSGGSLPGTINISPAVMSLLVSDTLCSLAAQGFRNFYLVLGHGGSENLTALQEALKGLLRGNPAFGQAMICLFPAWKFGPEATGWKKGFAEGDWHAGWLETSLMLALAPELVRMEELATDSPELMARLTAHPDSYQRAEKIV